MSTLNMILQLMICITASTRQMCSKWINVKKTQLMITMYKSN